MLARRALNISIVAPLFSPHDVGHLGLLVTRVAGVHLALFARLPVDSSNLYHQNGVIQACSLYGSQILEKNEVFASGSA